MAIYVTHDRRAQVPGLSAGVLFATFIVTVQRQKVAKIQFLLCGLPLRNVGGVRRISYKAKFQE